MEGISSWAAKAYSIHDVPLVSNAGHLHVEKSFMLTGCLLILGEACVPRLEEVLSSWRSFASPQRRDLRRKVRWLLASEVM